MYRVERNKEKDTVTVLRLLPPDAAGNSHWVTVVTLKGRDVVLARSAGNRYVPARVATDLDIIESITGGGA